MSIYFLFLIILIVSLPSFSLRRQLGGFTGANGCILVLETELGSCHGYEFGKPEIQKKSKRTKKKSIKRHKKHEKKEDDSLIFTLPFDQEIKGSEKLELSLADLPEEFDVDALDLALGLGKKHQRRLLGKIRKSNTIESSDETKEDLAHRHSKKHKIIESSDETKNDLAPRLSKKHKKKKGTGKEHVEEGSDIGLDLNIELNDE